MSDKNPSMRNYFIVYCILWLVWTGLHTLILYQNGISIHTAFTDSLISNIILFTFCIVISNILRYYQPGKNSSKYLFVWCLTLSGIWFLLIKGIITVVLQYDDDFMLIFTGSQFLRFVLANLFIGGSILLMWVWQNNKNRHEENLRYMQSLQLAKDAELSGLRQQLQPHFLFNSLNSISALAGSQPEKARLMIQQLSDFLRGTLRKGENGLVTLTEEISNVILYLEIEKVRFGHRLETKIEIDEACGKMLVPALILQPVVENSIKHGLYDTLEAILISINVSSNDNELLISVNNPFNQDNKSTTKGIGFGLTSLKRRLFLLYNRSDLLKTNSDNSIFTVTLIIPQ